MSTFYGWLSVDPPLLLHTSNDKLFQYLPEQPLARIQVYPWHHSADEIYAFHEHDRRHRPHDRLYHCVNTAETCAALRARGVDVEFVTPNAFLDERRYRVLGEAARPVQAVYNGRMNPFKRHWLAREIRSLMIIGGVYAPDDTWEYFDEVRGVLPHAWFTHAENHLFRTPDEVTELLNHARIGLCLSACEGAMYAATEYLLCGLPVVSTASLGGRDSWFEPEYTRIVEDTPEAVAAAVDELDALKIPPEDVRSATLRRMAEQRERYFSLGRKIYRDLGVNRDFVSDFHRHFENKLGDWRATEELMRFYDDKRQAIRAANGPKSIDSPGPLLH